MNSTPPPSSPGVKPPSDESATIARQKATIEVLEKKVAELENHLSLSRNAHLVDINVTKRQAALLTDVAVVVRRKALSWPELQEIAGEHGLSIETYL